MRALLSPTDGTPREVDVANGDGGSTLADLQRLVGGDFETLPFPDRDDVAPYFHAEGKYAGPDGRSLPRNELGTALLASVIQARDYIAGDLVLLGFDEDTGESADLPADFDLPAPPDLSLLLEEPRVDRQDRRVQHDWLLRTDDDGQRHYVVLTVSYNQGGRKMFSGNDEQRCYQATLSRETEKDSAYSGGVMRGFRLFSALLLCRSDEVGRYSAKRLEEYAPIALARLRELAAEGHPKVGRYFGEAE